MTSRAQPCTPRQRCRYAWALCVLLSWPWTAARAQEVKNDKRAEYERVVAAAVQEFANRHFAESLSLFHRAHTLAPSARTFRGIGMTAFEMGDYQTSIRALEAALAHREKPLEDKLREASEALLARARSFVAEVEVSVIPRTARVTLDDVPVDIAGGPVFVAVGSHTVSVSAEGYDPERRVLQVLGGEHLRVEVQLTLRAATTALDAADPVGYRELVASALEAFRLRDFGRSLELFEQAYALYPNARTLRGMGLTEFELGHYARALGHIEAALASPLKPLDTALRREMEKLRLRTLSSVATLRISTTPKQAEVSLDGHKLLRTDAPIRVDPGRHEVRAQADGFEPALTALTLEAGAERDLRFSLVPQQEKPRHPAVAHTTRWTLLGVGAASLSVGAYFGVSALVTYKHAEERCPDRIACSESVLDDRARAERHANIANATLAASALALVGASVWYWVERRATRGSDVSFASPPKKARFGLTLRF